MAARDTLLPSHSPTSSNACTPCRGLVQDQRSEVWQPMRTSAMAHVLLSSTVSDLTRRMGHPPALRSPRGLTGPLRWRAKEVKRQEKGGGVAKQVMLAAVRVCCGSETHLVVRPDLVGPNAEKGGTQRPRRRRVL